MNKNKYLLKKLLKWANKKQNNFNIYIAALFQKKKNKEKHQDISLFYTCVTKILMIWSTVPEQQTEIGNFRSFFVLLPPKNLRNQNFEKIKRIAGDIIISRICTKNLWYGVRQTEFFVIILGPFTPLTICKIKILEKWKKYTWRYCFTLLYHKW